MRRPDAYPSDNLTAQCQLANPNAGHFGGLSLLRDEHCRDAIPAHISYSLASGLGRIGQDVQTSSCHFGGIGRFDLPASGVTGGGARSLLWGTMVAAGRRDWPAVPHPYRDHFHLPQEAQNQLYHLALTPRYFYSVHHGVRPLAHVRPRLLHAQPSHEYGLDRADGDLGRTRSVHPPDSALNLRETSV